MSPSSLRAILDAAVSLYHQGDNLDRRRMREELGSRAERGRTPRPAPCMVARGSITTPYACQDLKVVADRRDAHARPAAQAEQSHVVPDARLRECEARLLSQCDGVVPDATWPDLVLAAQFDQMRARADLLAPDALGVLIDRTRFFRHGSSGDGVALLSADELEHYHRRAAALAPTDLLSWLHRDDRSR